MFAQPFGDADPDCLERKAATGLTPVHRQDVEAEARLHELRIDPRVSAVEECLLELGHGLAVLELAEDPALPPRGAVRVFAGVRFEAGGLALELREHELRFCAQR